MDRLKKARGPMRASFSRTYNALVAATAVAEPDLEAIEVLSLKLERVGDELDAADREICKLLLDDEASEEVYEVECVAMEEYRDKRDSMRIKTRKILNTAASVDTSNVSGTTGPAVSKRKFKLPKLELVKFGGEVKEWLTFWSQFKKIHEDVDMVPEDKFQYLIQATVNGSRARELVNSFPPTAENYPKAIEGLKSRFGKEELLVEVYVRELLKLVIQNASGNKAKLTMSTLYDKLESYLRALESIGMASDKYAAMLFPLVESCLPDEILRAWQRNFAFKATPDANGAQSGRLNQLLGFLRNEVESEERISLAREGFDVPIGQGSGRSNRRRRSPEGTTNQIPTATDLFSGEKRTDSKMTCQFCDKGHESKDCFQAQKMTLEEKKGCLMKKKGCFLCLKAGHRSRHCRLNTKCPICGRKHLVLMCPELPAHKEKPEKLTGGNREEKTEASNALSTQRLLQTLMITAQGRKGKRTVRAIFDLGSQRSYILKSTAEELGCHLLGHETLSHALFGGAQTGKKLHYRFEVSVSDPRGDYEEKLQVLDQEVICGTIPRIKSGPWLRELKEHSIWISDVGDEHPKIELLIGADVAGMFLTGRMHRLETGPYAVETKLGWTLMGKLPEDHREAGVASLFVTTLLSRDSSVMDLWELEKIGIKDPVEVKTRKEMELAALDHFRKTVKVDAEGRYEVELPWIEGYKGLPENRHMAEKRLMATTRRLMLDGRYELYEAVFDDWLKEGVIERVPQEEKSNPGHYLPHTGVFKEHSTTKMRPVFDASARAKNAPSLNDCLEKGPNLIELIPSVLTRFREKRLGVQSDIRRAFLQISVKDSDRDFLRFLWWESYAERTVKVLRHRRVVFGVTSSPFLLGAVVTNHLQKSPDEKRNTARQLARSFYVDNCLTSVDSEEELTRFMKEARELMSVAHFDLRGWEYTALNQQSLGNEPTSVLGLSWDRQTDELYCNMRDAKPAGEAVTKRNILSVVQQIFDPIGYTCPFTVFPKMLLQESWNLKIGWDDELPEEMCRRFNDWYRELPVLSSLRIPRCISADPSRVSWSLHTFCDASQTAYAAVVFLRSATESRVYVQLVAAKARVAPLKKVTIPRLELLACTIGSRLAATVMSDLDLNNVPVYYWSDSTTALSWIQRNTEWGTFVRNRVEEIRTLSDPDDWRHVPGDLNPADTPSRGCPAKVLLSSRWWEGPEWLKSPPASWPDEKTRPNEGEIEIERKKGIIATTFVAEGEVEWYLNYFSRYSSIVRMIAWILRFVGNARKDVGARSKEELTVQEMDSAEKRILKIVQESAFGAGGMENFRTLGTFKDEDDLLRVKTKITYRRDREEFRSPVLLPARHPLVALLIREEHLKNCHAGTQMLLAILRERFWILRGRKTVRAVVDRCVACRRFGARSFESTPAPLPEDRVRDASIFEIVGVDLAGPLHLREKTKSWIILFTCAVYRAVHLELITSLSTEAFLQGLRRFVARRGRPSTVYSGNGTNFVGANNLLLTLDWKTVEKEASTLRIQWKFNPPTAAWWGGWWERLIQLTKRLLRRTLGRTSLTYEELATVLCDIEAVINSRPLTYLSEDTGDLVPLSPAMFLQEVHQTAVPDLDLLDRRDLTKKLRYRQRLRDDVRKRFRVEYLGQLVQRAQENHHRDIAVGDIALVGGENSKRVNWPMARVVEIFPGRDRHVRVARLKTSTGDLVRPIQKIYPLEVSMINDDDVGRENVEGQAATPQPMKNGVGEMKRQLRQRLVSYTV